MKFLVLLECNTNVLEPLSRASFKTNGIRAKPFSYKMRNKDKIGVETEECAIARDRKTFPGNETKFSLFPNLALFDAND